LQLKLNLALSQQYYYNKQVSFEREAGGRGAERHASLRKARNIKEQADEREHYHFKKKRRN
jgi:hypothetical protein